MASRYRVEYALKQHRKDDFIEWIKGLLSVPFVLQAGTPSQKLVTREKEQETLERYAVILRDVEKLIEAHSKFPLHSFNFLTFLIDSSNSFRRWIL